MALDNAGTLYIDQGGEEWAALPNKVPGSAPFNFASFYEPEIDDYIILALDKNAALYLISGEDWAQVTDGF
jgi:hypothetical protein